MCADDTSLDPTPENDNPSATPQDNQTDTPQDTPKSGPIWSWPRRKFLAAAALGTAAAALIGKDGQGLQFGALSASAAASGFCPDGVTPDLSFLSCTANDVTITGPGIVLNEPCAGCTNGTFNAQVQFPVSNNTSTGRYCIQISIGSGLGVPCQDVILTNTKGGGSTANPGPNTMVGTITGFPCNPTGGLVCLGAANTPASGACPSECVTVGWSTSSGSAGCTSPTKVPGGQCRHQQICIQGFGVQVYCSDSSCATGSTSSCSAICGAPLYLKAIGGGSTSSACSAAPTLTLTDQNGVVYPATSSTTSGLERTSCYKITGLAGGSYTFTVTATDCTGKCTRTSSIPVTVTVVAKPVVTAVLNNDCTGNTTYTVTNCDSTLTYTYQEVDCTSGANIGSAQSGLGKCTATFNFTPGTADATHCVNVTAANATGCTETTAAPSIAVPAQLTVTLASAGAPGCDGVVSLVATASGGSGTYSTFAFSGAQGTVTGTGNARTLTIQPTLNGACQSSTITVTDSNGCTAVAGPLTWSSCVTTTFNC